MGGHGVGGGGKVRWIDNQGRRMRRLKSEEKKREGDGKRREEEEMMEVRKYIHEIGRKRIKEKDRN